MVTLTCYCGYMTKEDPKISLEVTDQLLNMHLLYTHGQPNHNSTDAACSDSMAKQDTILQKTVMCNNKSHIVQAWAVLNHLQHCIGVNQ